MFSSDQIIDITSEFKNLPETLRFLIALYDDKMFKRKSGRVHIAFAHPAPGIIAIGTGSMEPLDNGYQGHQASRGWTDFQFNYDPDILAPFLKQWVKEQPRPHCPDTDGSVSLGIRIRSLSSIYGELRPNQQAGFDPFPSILYFTPHYNVYHK